MHSRGSGMCWIGRRTELWYGGELVFLPSTGWNTPVSLVGIVIMKLTHAIARVLKGIEIRAWWGATFGAGDMVLFVASLPVVRSRAPSSLSLGGRDHSAVAASSIPQGICSLHHGCSCLVVAPTVSRMDGGRRTRKRPEKDHCQEKRQEGGVVLASPWEPRAWGPAFPWGGEAIPRFAIPWLAFSQYQYQYRLLLIWLNIFRNRP
jgi:hypothetical protein